MKLGERLSADVAAARSLSELLLATEIFCRSAETIGHQVEVALSRRPDCRAGCFFCCHIPVAATAAEILLTAAYLRLRLSPELQQAIVERLRLYQAAAAGAPAAAEAALPIPCPLLVEGRCSVHPARPLACRKFHSLDVTSCVDFYEHPAEIKPVPPQAPELVSTWSRIIGLCDRAFAQQGYDGAGYELGSALLEALTDPEVPNRFLQKRPTFRLARQFWPWQTPPSSQGN